MVMKAYNDMNLFSDYMWYICGSLFQHCSLVEKDWMKIEAQETWGIE